MLMFTLAISCMTTSSLPWFMDLTFQVPMQYCSLQYQTLLLSPVTSTPGCCFCFGSLFILSGVISPLISSSIVGTYWPGEFIFQCPIFLPFHTVHGVLKARILKYPGTDGQKAHEKGLNITNYQRNANQNYNKVSLAAHTTENGHHQKAYEQ